MKDAESQIRDLCLKLSIGYPRLQQLRIEFTREHGKAKADAKLARYLKGLWDTSGDKPRYPAAGAGSSHVGDENFRWRTDHEPGCLCARCNEEVGYTNNPLRSTEPGAEAVPPHYQKHLSERSNNEFKLLRQNDVEMRELRGLAFRARDFAKRLPVGTSLEPILQHMREAVEAGERLERALEKAA